MTAPRTGRQRWLVATIVRLWHALLSWGEARALDEQSVQLIFAALCGALAAVGTVAFYSALDGAYALFFRWMAGDVPLIPRLLYRPAASALAMAAAAAIWRRVGAGDDGLTVPDVQLAVVRRGGRLPFGKAAGRTLASVITIGGGGSAGSEGPVAVLGAALSSRLSRAFRFTESRMRVLVGAGAAAGISAAFNAPLAGAFFALEEILGTFRGDHFAPVVVSSVVAAVISRAMFGDHPAFILPEHYRYNGALEVLWAFPLLGLACGVVAAGFVRGHFAMGAVMRSWQRDRWRTRVIPWVTGATVGAAVMLSGGLLVGVGHLSIPLEKFAAMSAWALLGLTVAKIFITSLTLTGGGSGGVFTPSLFVGASLGSAIAVVLRAIVPHFTSAPEAYALVGMGAMVAATTGAPITAALLVFEISGDYAIVLPLMMCVALSQIIARRFTPDDLYSGGLRRRGERLEHGRDRAVLEQIRVRAVFAASAPTLGEGASMNAVLTCFARETPSVVPVLDDEQRLLGVLTTSELSAVAQLTADTQAVLVAGDLAAPSDVVSVDDTLAVTVARMGRRGRDALPVIEPATGRVVGVVDRGHLLAAYEQVVRTE